MEKSSRVWGVPYTGYVVGFLQVLFYSMLRLRHHSPLLKTTQLTMATMYTEMAAQRDLPMAFQQDPQNICTHEVF